MQKRKITRREFIRLSGMVTAGLVAAACVGQAPVPPAEAPQPQPAAAEAAKTEEVMAGKYNEAPMLAELVKSGALPPVDERLPKEPMIIEPIEEIGQYGGAWRRIGVGPGDVGIYKYRLMYGNLIRYNIDGTAYVPNLAKSWEVSDDGTTYTFYLREGTRWSDGEPFTADDILYWYEDELLNEELSPSFPTWLNVGGESGKVEKVDDFTVRFVFPGTYGLFMTLMAGAFGWDMVARPKHYLSQFHPNYAPLEELEKQAKAEQYEFWYQLYLARRDETINTELPVLWTWRFTKVSPEIPVVQERNPYYWKVDTAGNQLPYLDKVSTDIVENAEVLNLKAVAGEIDMQTRHILFDNYPLFVENADKGGYHVILWTNGDITDTVIAINQCHKDPVVREIVGDKRFRYALSHAINRPEVIESVYLGQGVPGQVSPLPSSPFYLESQAQNALEYDPDKANSLLDEMGLTEKDGEGFRKRPDGETLLLTIEYASLFGSWASITELLQKYWGAVGVKLNIKEEARPLFYERKAALEHDIGIWTGASEFNPLIDPRWFIPFSDESIQAICYAYWHNTGGTTGEEPTGDFAKVLELFEQIKATADQSKQIELFHEILRINQDNLWTIGIATQLPAPVIVNNNFHNVPEKAISTWHLQTPGNTMPEQYFKKA